MSRTISKKIGRKGKAASRGITGRDTRNPITRLTFETNRVETRLFSKTMSHFVPPETPNLFTFFFFPPSELKDRQRLIAFLGPVKNHGPRGCGSYRFFFVFHQFSDTILFYNDKYSSVFLRGLLSYFSQERLFYRFKQYRDISGIRFQICNAILGILRVPRNVICARVRARRISKN